MALDVLRYAVFAVFPVAMAYAAASDLLTMTISNKLTLGLVACFVVLAPFTGMGWNAFATALGGGGGRPGGHVRLFRHGLGRRRRRKARHGHRAMGRVPGYRRNSRCWRPFSAAC